MRSDSSAVLLFVRHRREHLGLSTRSVYDLSLLLAGGVLVGGRLVEVAFYEWPFYRERLHLIPAMWLGGMATHGLLAGGIVGVWIFCRVRGKSFLRVTDALSIPAAFILGIGRLGNFIDGQIVGSVTSVRWAVKFPDAEGYRHPVVLYDGIKNLLLIPVLYFAGLRRLPPGVLTGLFLFLYAFLRLFVDLFREYPTTLLGLATGQALNILMSMVWHCADHPVLATWAWPAGSRNRARAGDPGRDWSLPGSAGGACCSSCCCCSRSSSRATGPRMFRFAMVAGTRGSAIQSSIRRSTLRRPVQTRKLPQRPITLVDRPFP